MGNVARTAKYGPQGTTNICGSLNRRANQSTAILLDTTRLHRRGQAEIVKLHKWDRARPRLELHRGLFQFQEVGWTDSGGALETRYVSVANSARPLPDCFYARGAKAYRTSITWCFHLWILLKHPFLLHHLFNTVDIHWDKVGDDACTGFSDHDHVFESDVGFIFGNH